MSFLKANGIGKSFDKFWALRDINFSVEQGEFVTLLGPSGCGKTTLLNIIAGFIPLTHGELLLNGEDIGHLPPEKRDSAMCFQSYALFPHLTVRENIAFGPKQKKIDAVETARRVNGIIEKISLDQHEDKLPNALSGGQQQRVALARALAVRPGIVLFDEPLSNLDAKLREQVRVEIRALQNELGFTAMYVTHDQAEALAMSDQILLLNKGVIEQAGTPKEVYYSPKTRFVADFIGAANIHKANFLSDTNNTVCKTPFGELHLSPEKAGQLDRDASHYICWRPETTDLTESDNNMLSGVISSSAFQGSHTDVFITASDDTGTETVRLQLSGTFVATIGDTLRFHVAPESIIPLQDQAQVGSR